MKNADSKKLDQVLIMLGDMVGVFGKRFDKIERDMATKDQLIALQTQVNGIESDIRSMKHTKLHARVADLEEKVFGAARD
jgi:hypothetical protein